MLPPLKGICEAISPLLTPSQPSAVRGEMATRFREFDWGSTPLGPVERWPESWRNAVNIILDSSFPTALGLGDELIYFYNDAFIPLAGPSRHPHGLGVPVQIAWKEIWTQILEPRFKHTLSTGVPTGEADLLMPLQRSGYLEETFVTFSFAALRDAQSRPSGIFCTAIETTARVIADRQLVCLRALAAQGSLAETPEGACQAAVATLEANPRDLPFALLYLVERGSRRARLAGTVGLVSVPDTVPAFVDLSSGSDPWQLSVVAQTRTASSVDNVQSLIGGFIRVADTSPGRAVSLPIASHGDSDLAAILVAGANPMRPLEESRTFHTLIAGHLETALSNARAKQYARERAQALAELDRAKTLFFSNISHELRTPLTLLLAPLDETLARDRLESVDRQSLEIARRGGGRLLKLVNSLLEFSRIEAGRIEAAFEPADLAALTTDLASMFRSAFERAGVALTIDCNPAPEPVYVDRDKWEKIVLNLVSNALKFTFSGAVQVIQRTQADHIQLEVTDSGCGIAPDDLVRVFERFFRGRVPQTRTHEGSGIGLSLVQELVKLHGGTIVARSELGVGTTMTVRIPRGSAHLDANRIVAPRQSPASRAGLHAFVEEALGWLPDKQPRSAPIGPAPADPSVQEQPAANPRNEPLADILVVDDNADMRGYLCHLLEERWRTEGATDGISALERIRRRTPDLVIADVMMPRLDGFGLLRALREDQATAQIPIMLLSARAGEEASAEALRAGADDYIIKPFSARELIARVEARLAQARLRAAERQGRDAAEKANQARDEFFAMLSHELRTPLMAVLGWTALLKGSRLGPQDMAYAVDIIERNARTQRRMIDDLLDVSRIVTGRLRIDARPIPSLAPVIAMVVDSFRPVAHGKGLTVVTDLANDAGPLRADPERLQQVAWNLLSNAIHFTPPGGRIEVRCSRQDSQAVLYVRDTGRGISQEAVPHIFERYWQAGSTRTRRQGLGLGLAIAHKIVELHTGSIEVASGGEGKGSVFTVWLPIAEPLHSIEPGVPPAPADFEPLAAASARILDAATATAERDPDSTASGALQILGMTTPLRSANSDYSETSLRILLVEDHDGIARACQRLLVSHGHFVVRAAGAASALAAAEREIFDLLVCDLSLPDGSGYELLPEMRSRSKSPEVPAIAISGSVYEDDIARCLTAGFSAHVAKPFDEDGLLAVIAEVMGQVSRQGTAKSAPAVGNGGILSPAPARLR
ncbi:MAG: multi-sensor hybrid histidine kinase [Gammaproteobacteria bacterium]|nr:multi-sensor hybrid histidine kinase [Gammaproteobacteria bacterium]